MAVLAQLSPLPIMQFFDGNGVPLAGGQLFTFQAGTTTPQPSYTDATATVQNPNPIILDSQGRCQIWLTNAGYKLQLKDSNNVQQWLVDQVFLIPPGFVGTAQIADNSVTTAKIQNNAVTTVKIPDGAITTAKILDAAITASKIANGIITAAKLDTGFNVSQITANMEVVFRNINDGGPDAIPQFQWTAPTLITGTLDSPPSNGPSDICWSPNEEFLVVAPGTAGKFYQRFGVTFKNNGFGAIGGATAACAYSGDGQFIAAGGSVSPFIALLQKAGLNFVALATPGTTPPGTVTSMAWSRGGERLAVCSSVSPFLVVYVRAGSITTPTFNAMTVTAPPGAANACAWTPDGQYLLVGCNTSPFTSVYQVTGVNTLTQIGSPATPAGSVISCDFSPDQTLLAMGLSVSPFLALHSFSGGGFTLLPNPSSLPLAAPKVSFSPNSFLLATGSTSVTTPLIIYQRSGTSFTAIAAPSSPTAGGINALRWSPSNEFLAMAVAASPFVQFYQTGSPTFPANAATWVRGLTAL